MGDKARDKPEYIYTELENSQLNIYLLKYQRDSPTVVSHYILKTGLQYRRLAAHARHLISRKICYYIYTGHHFVTWASMLPLCANEIIFTHDQIPVFKYVPHCYHLVDDIFKFISL